MTLQTIADQASPETPMNENYEALTPASIYARNPITSTGLTWGYYGGWIVSSGSPSAMVQVADGTLTLDTGNNFIEADPDTGAVSRAAGSPDASGFTPGKIPLYVVVVASGAVSSYSDRRCFQLATMP